MKQHCVKNGDTKTESIRLAMPFSLRHPPTHPTDFPLLNDFAVWPIEMRLISDLTTGIKQIKQDLSSVKTSPMPYGWYYSAALV